jgi:tetratricopeptide (TPR) repeat protein
MNEEPEVIIQYDDELRNILDKKYYHGVIRKLRTEIESQEDRRKAAVLCFEIGRIFETHMGDLFQASTHYQEALQKHGTFLPAIRALRRISLQRGNWSQFIALTDTELRTVSDDRKRSQLWLERAEVLYYQLGDFDETMVSIRKSLELDTANTRTLWFMETILREKKNFRELVSKLKDLASKVTSNELACSLLYEAARISEVKEDEPDGAIQLYEMILEKDPDHVQSMNALNRLYYKKKMFRPLIKILVKRAEKTAGRKKARILYSVARIYHERLSGTPGGPPVRSHHRRAREALPARGAVREARPVLRQADSTFVGQEGAGRHMHASGAALRGEPPGRRQGRGDVPEGHRGGFPLSAGLRPAGVVLREARADRQYRRHARQGSRDHGEPHAARHGLPSGGGAQGKPGSI